MYNAPSDFGRRFLQNLGHSLVRLGRRRHMCTLSAATLGDNPPDWISPIPSYRINGLLRGVNTAGAAAELRPAGSFTSTLSSFHGSFAP